MGNTWGTREGSEGAPTLALNGASIKAQKGIDKASEGPWREQGRGTNKELMQWKEGDLQVGTKEAHAYAED